MMQQEYRRILKEVFDESARTTMKGAGSLAKPAILRHAARNDSGLGPQHKCTEETRTRNEEAENARTHANS